MKYEQRKRIISQWLFESLKRYEAPTHLDQAASREEMVLMVEDMNSEIPQLNEGGFNGLLERVGTFVRKNHGSRKWPTIKLLVAGIKEHRDGFIHEHSEPIAKSHNSDLAYTDRIAIKRIKEGGEIADWILDPASVTHQRYIDQGHLTEKDFDKYRRSY